MGVYVKGMEMPSCCMFCPISNASGCGMMNPPVLMTSKEMLADCPDWCPLVPVTPHGRLIEKNAVFELIQSVPSVDKLLPVEFMKALYEIPTVIEAEEGE